ncbi:MAG: MerR family transcriptional regulator [Candidatus Krumholzibacteriia bacterium]
MKKRPSTGSREIRQLYDITSLEKVTGVPRRTIHYYVKEQLLPPPKGRGPSAHYTEDHRLRLRFITLMKESTHLRLEGIREAIESLSGAELAAEVLRMELWSGGPVAEEPPTTGHPITDPEAPDVRQSLINEMALTARKYRDHGPDKPATGDADAGERVPDTIRAAAPLRLSRSQLYHKIMRFGVGPPDEAAAGLDATGGGTPDENAGTWTRIRITHDLEIHFRPHAGGRFHKKLRKLVAAARKSFGK